MRRVRPAGGYRGRFRRRHPAVPCRLPLLGRSGGERAGRAMSQLIEDITALYREYRAAPILVAVWCVDRPDALARIRALLEREAPVAPTSIVGQIPIYERSE